MEQKQPNMGRSLPVPCVQDLAKKPLTSIPPQYIRPDQESPFICNANLAANVPVIDMSNLLSADFMDSEHHKFHHACKEWGFFQLINHGVSNSLMEKMKAELPNFFNLPMEEKKKYWQEPGDIQGFGQAFVVSEEQKLDWGDMFAMYTLPTYLRKPHLFPKLPLPFRDTLEAYSTELRNLALKILYQIAKALKMDPNYIKDLFDDGVQIMRMNYYPPCQQPELLMGLTSHSDGGGLTILLQINEMDGLQIKKDGLWVPIKAIPDAFIINIGDVLEIVTNGFYPSIEHRAIINAEKERMSIATFYNPKLDGEFGPAPSLVKLETPAFFKRITYGDYLKGYLSRELRSKSYIDNFRIQNEGAKRY